VFERGSNEDGTWANKKNQDGNWRIRTNEEIDLLMKHTVRYIKAQRIRWVGHVVRLGKEIMVKRITEWGPTAIGRIGRPRLRWIMSEDLGRMKI
jgi:hypothetical protein